MILFNSKYFGEISIFEFDDCYNIPEIAIGYCHTGNTIELMNSVILILMIFSFGLGLTYLIHRLILKRSRK